MANHNDAPWKKYDSAPDASAAPGPWSRYEPDPGAMVQLHPAAAPPTTSATRQPGQRRAPWPCPRLLSAWPTLPPAGERASSWRTRVALLASGRSRHARPSTNGTLTPPRKRSANSRRQRAWAASSRPPSRTLPTSSVRSLNRCRPWVQAAWWRAGGRSHAAGPGWCEGDCSSWRAG